MFKILETKYTIGEFFNNILISQYCGGKMSIPTTCYKNVCIFHICFLFNFNKKEKYEEKIIRQGK